MPDAKIIFFGSDAICLPVLNYLHEHKAGVSLHALISQPDRPSGRGKQLQSNPAATWAQENGVTLLQPDKPDNDLAEWIRAEGVQISLVMAYGHFLPSAVRAASAGGIFNFHGSILPAYRGASPVETALAEGDHETGVSLMEVGAAMDAGGVCDIKRLEIQTTDTSQILRERLGKAVVPLLKRNLAGLLDGNLSFKPQEAGAVTYCRKIQKCDGILDFDLSARQLECRLRAFSPWPGGAFEYEGTTIKVGRATVISNLTKVVEGTVISADAQGLAIATGSGVLCVHELQRPGGRMLAAGEFLRGFGIKVGAVLRGAKSVPLVRKEL
ncbi:MAG: Methionyl-tRNA formyltransferase [Opitutia bacterium UBA7350]|nr:MAG: Methionyl-tRNA formyltransferase [Opitutae bacterium UBA7350]